MAASIQGVTKFRSGVHVNHDTAPDRTVDDSRAKLRYICQSGIDDHLIQLFQRQVGCDTRPCPDAVLVGSHHAIYSQKVDPAQQEGDDAGWQTRTARKPDSGNRGAVSHLPQHPREHRTADGIHASGPCLGLERAFDGFGKVGARDDPACTEIAQICLCLGASGYGGYRVAGGT